MKEFKIILKNKDETNELILSEKHQFEEKENFVVSHFKPYECLLEVTDKSIKKVTLSIADIIYEMDSIEEKDGKCIFKFPQKYYFQCIWGYSVLILKIYDDKEKSYYMYSKLINVILDPNIEESKNIENSVKEMIKFIIDNNIDFSLNTSYWRNSINNTNFLGENSKTIYNELNQLEQIIQTYSKNKEYFLNNLKYKLLLDYKVEDFEKVKIIDKNILKFIIQNPQYLQKTESARGILYKKWYYSPTKTLVDSKKFDYNIEENKIILGFLKYIYIYIEQRLVLIKRILENNKKGKYYTLENIINFYYEFYYNQLSEMKPIFESLYFYYKKVMKCSEEIIEVTPKFSSIFKNYNHYKEIYIVIHKWFQNKNYNIDEKNTLNSLITIDKIYEYYSLGKLIKGVLKLGYVSEKMYIYKYSKDIFSQSKELNTFIFYKNLKKLTLYYQPYIYTDRFENGIELYRVEGNTTKIYTPDFIIKIEVPNKKNRYLVLDSKWQKNKTLKNYTLKEIIYKYCYSIEGTEEVDYLNTIILQGKEDISTNYSFQNSMLSLKAKNIKKPKLEIVPLNPKINKLNYVLKIIEELF